MIIQILAGVVAVFGLALLIRSLWVKSGLSSRQTWLTVGAAVLILGLIGLAASGRLHWLVAAGAAMVPFARRLLGLIRIVPMLNTLFPGWHQRFRTQGMGSGGQAGQRTTAEAAYLRMNLDHASGHMDGEVTRGRFEGRFLSELSQAELMDLAAEIDDIDSTRLLEAYLDQVFPGWKSRQHSNQGAPPPPPGDMSREQALEVLGLTAGASKEDIVTAHRRLIQKLHPDRGGSAYLAATLNQAKQVLLDSR